MDFKTATAPAGGMSEMPAEALLLLVPAKTAMDGLTAALGAALAEALRLAAKEGDLEMKAGQSLYLHRVAGAKARRVWVAVASDATPQALAKAAASAAGGVKSSGARQLSVAVVDAAGPTVEQAQALVLALRAAVYSYRHTKPSAPAPSKLQTVQLVVAKEQAAAIKAALQRASAIADGVEMARPERLERA